ncbi:MULTISPECIES: YeeE/YedE family protein [Vibrio]|uniref:Transporter n=1 Tax=Vibrio bivalvicida TaxID=1276888 RepID=A0A177Y5H0_9VIBR|nr:MULTISPECIES: YeeE/YedE family protein [Vibrio]KLN63724.1 transporter [Vibrio sp. VPAP30]OAJ95856.1 transporter [Vibrio bivalvicida]
MRSTILRLAPLVSGLLFGVGMTISGMIEPQKVIGFLDVMGEWDPSLSFVMGGALMVFMPFHWMYIKKKSTAMDGSFMSTPTQNKVDAKLVIGAAVFGLGWGLAGICPGPAVASLALGNSDILLFFSSMLAGSLFISALSLSTKKFTSPVKAN